MSKISRKKIEAIASLAKIKLLPKEKSYFASQLETILNYFENIQKIVLNEELEEIDHFKLKQNQLRDDQVEENNLLEIKQGIRANFSQKKGKYLKVKAIFDNE